MSKYTCTGTFETNEPFNPMFEQLGQGVISAIESVIKPWGRYDTYFRSSDTCIKTLTINPGKKISNQKHFHRAERWEVISGRGVVCHQDWGENTTLKPGTVFDVRVGEWHQVLCDGKEPLVCLEVQMGKPYEEDIERGVDVL